MVTKQSVTVTSLINLYIVLLGILIGVLMYIITGSVVAVCVVSRRETTVCVLADARADSVG